MFYCFNVIGLVIAVRIVDLAVDDDDVDDRMMFKYPATE
jgi:hypothetical protein